MTDTEFKTEFPDAPRLALRDHVRSILEDIYAGDQSLEADAFLDSAEDRGLSIELPR